MLMNYTDALQFIYGGQDYEKFPPTALGPDSYNLARFHSLLDRLGNPHLACPTIHITGSKGKGSVAHYLSGILNTAGYRTGLYTSPHLRTPRERIRIADKPLSEEAFAAAAEEVAGALPNNNPDDYRTVFEILTAIAFVAFRQAGTELAVVEVGMGGRLDATNVVKPILGIITRIELEHTQLLGDRPVKIAREKAGIIKPGMELIISPQHGEPMTLIRLHASRQGVPVTLVSEAIKTELEHHRMQGESFLIRAADQSTAVAVNLHNWGRTQVIAARTAYAASLRLNAMGYKLDGKIIATGLSSTRIPGRIEPVARSPLTILDVAHHPLAVKYLVRALHDRNLRRFSLVFGSNRDKDWRGMLDLLIPGTRHIYLASSQNPRAVDVEEMAEYLQGKVNEVSQVARVAEGVRLACSDEGSAGTVVVTGSFYVVGEAMEELGVDG